MTKKNFMTPQLDGMSNSDKGSVFNAKQCDGLTAIIGFVS